MQKYTRYYYIVIIASLVIALDQFTKYLVITKLPIHSSVNIIEGYLNIVNIRNLGAAFGILNTPDITWQFWLFSFATLLATGIIYNLAKTSKKDYLLFTALGLILGGAYGNLIDRIRYRAVIDFLDFYYKSYHWPAFNVADIAICCGVFIAIISMFISQRQEKGK